MPRSRNPTRIPRSTTNAATPIGGRRRRATPSDGRTRRTRQEASMSYPEARYRGETGEATATMRRADTPADLVYPTGTTVDYLATGASTDRLFGLYRWTMPGGGSGRGPHFHRALDES